MGERIGAAIELGVAHRHVAPADREPVREPPCGVDEELPVYTGRVEASASFNIVPFMETATLSLAVSYQACTDSLCYPPDSAVLDIPLKGVDLIRE